MNTVARQLVLWAGALLLPWSLAISLAQSPELSGDELADLRARAQRGEVEAQWKVGKAYFEGKAAAKDPYETFNEAVKWWGKAAEQGHAEAQFHMAAVCGATGELDRAAKWLRRAAEQGYAAAQEQLGYSYSSGQGVPKDATEAVKWYRKAADQNSANAQYNLGVCYSDGQGVPKDATEAVKWFRKAADQNSAYAQYNLAYSYSSGQGVPKDATEAVKWFRKAADQNSANAQCSLGVCYNDGQGVPKDATEAVKWFRKAADQNSANAQYNLGVCYRDGQGVPKDATEAVKWFRRAAEQGLGAAQAVLGLHYALGQGVPKDRVEAYKWLNLAAAGGAEAGTKARDLIEPEMTPSQVAEGQRLSREFRPCITAPPGSEGERSQAKAILHDLPAGTGSGFFITPDGYLVTNCHVVEGGTSFKVLTAAGPVPARLIKRDPANDVAVLKVEGRFNALVIAPSRGVKLGQPVATVGFPNLALQGFSPKLARGEIASLAGVQDDARHFQISVPLQPGNSGGALVDVRGNVVGVILGKLDQGTALATSGNLPELVNYAIKSSFLLSFLESIPAVVNQLQEPGSHEAKFEDMVATVEKATVLVLVYQ